MVEVFGLQSKPHFPVRHHGLKLKLIINYLKSKKINTMKKNIKVLIVCLIFQTFALVCYANSNRFSGGSFDGFDDSVFEQSCLDDVNSNKRYGGGSFDGYDDSIFEQSCLDDVNSNKRYGGGSFDGYDDSIFEQSGDENEVNSNQRYGGGAYDGYSDATFIQSGVGNGDLNSKQRFSGGFFDGYDNAVFGQSGSGADDLNSKHRFSGGFFDGFDNAVFGQSGSGADDLNSKQRFSGGFFDGYNNSIYAQSDRNLTTFNQRFGGGSFDGYDNNYFEYPTPFIEITNATKFRVFSQTTAEISGTNVNITGQLAWLNNRFPNATNWFNQGFEVEVTNLAEGSNTLTIIGANYLSNYVSDSVVIYRETFDDVHPFIDITNAPAEVNFDITSAEISGTNLNIAGQLGIINNQHSETTNYFDTGFSTNIFNLEHGDNLIEIFGTNVYGHSTNSVVTIHRETFDEVHPFIKITNVGHIVAYNISSAEISGTNLNIAGQLGIINDQYLETTNFFAQGFSTIISLEYGDNLIEVFGTNVYGMVTNDFVTIHRETWEETKPFINITNTPAIVSYIETTAEISGTNLNIAGNLGWTNSLTCESGNFQISNLYFQVSNINLAEGDNLIQVFGTNKYGFFTNDFATIHRETFAEVHPFIDITNENAIVTYSVTSYTIGGTNNANVIGGLNWTNSLTCEFGETQISNFKFQISNFKLNTGDNLITVSGTNIYGQSTNDVVCIRRKTLIESEPQIATNALIFPSPNSELFEGDTTNIIWNFEKITDDIDGTNLTITKISVHVSETTNEVSIITNNINNLLGEILWMVPAELIGSETNYVLNFEVVDSSSLTNSRIFWDNKFTIIPEPAGIWIIGLIVSLSSGWLRKRNQRM